MKHKDISMKQNCEGNCTAVNLGHWERVREERYTCLNYGFGYGYKEYHGLQEESFTPELLP